MAEPAIVGTLLRPVDPSKFRVDHEPNAPSCLILPIGIAAPRLDERLQLQAIEITTHDTHALAVAPIELTAFLIENHLFRSVGRSQCDAHAKGGNGRVLDI